jgi:predicted transcriptional regulator
MKFHITPIEEVRKGLSFILLNEEDTTYSLAEKIGIAYSTLYKFMQGRGHHTAVTEMKIRRFVMDYGMIKEKK